VKVIVSTSDVRSTFWALALSSRRVMAEGAGWTVTSLLIAERFPFTKREESLTTLLYSK
jgi:hypothetical protein